jgi:hypothetical protein
MRLLVSTAEIMQEPCLICNRWFATARPTPIACSQRAHSATSERTGSASNGCASGLCVDRLVLQFRFAFVQGV